MSQATSLASKPVPPVLERARLASSGVSGRVRAGSGTGPLTETVSPSQRAVSAAGRPPFSVREKSTKRDAAPLEGVHFYTAARSKASAASYFSGMRSSRMPNMSRPVRPS